MREFQIAQGAPGTGYLTVPQMVQLHAEARYRHPPTPLPEHDLIDLLRRSEAGEAAAQLLRGQLHDTWYAKGALPKDNAEAVRWYRKAAEQGQLEAATNLGWILKDGDGVEPDPAEAARWLALAGQSGGRHALFGLAELHETGNGVRQDKDEAIRLLRRAAEHPEGGEAIAKLRSLGAWRPAPATARATAGAGQEPR
jgi:TPR repeat protein